MATLPTTTGEQAVLATEYDETAALFYDFSDATSAPSYDPSLGESAMETRGPHDNPSPLLPEQAQESGDPADALPSEECLVSGPKSGTGLHLVDEEAGTDGGGRGTASVSEALAVQEFEGASQQPDIGTSVKANQHEGTGTSTTNEHAGMLTSSTANQHAGTGTSSKLSQHADMGTSSKEVQAAQSSTEAKAEVAAAAAAAEVKKKGHQKSKSTKKSGSKSQVNGSSASASAPPSSSSTSSSGAGRAGASAVAALAVSVEAQRRSEDLFSELQSVEQRDQAAPEEKADALHAMGMHQAKWLKTLAKDILGLEQRLVQLRQEKEAAASEASRSAAVRSKLESLCRELQAQNKAVIAESKEMAEAEHQKRKQLSEQFLASIKDVEKRLEEQGDSQGKFFEENRRLLEQLQHANQEAELRAKEREYEAKKFGMEQQIAALKLQQQQELTRKERSEKEVLMEHIRKQQAEQEELQKQMSDYGKRFQECQEMLAKSNEVMSKFKEDRSKLVARLEKAEKETGELRAKCTKSDATLIQLLEENKSLKNQLGVAKMQKEKLEGLCRILQEERKKAQSLEGTKGSSGTVHEEGSSNVVGAETSSGPASAEGTSSVDTPRGQQQSEQDSPAPEGIPV